jgi:hypothetical protein
VNFYRNDRSQNFNLILDDVKDDQENFGFKIHNRKEFLSTLIAGFHNAHPIC